MAEPSPAPMREEPAGTFPQTLRNRLLVWLLVPLAGIVLLNTVTTYREAVDAANTAYDRSLLASSRAIAERVSIRDGKVYAEVPLLALDIFEADNVGRIFFKVTGFDNEFVSGFDDLPPLPLDVPRAHAYTALVHFYDSNYAGRAIRVAALYQPLLEGEQRGIALIQVAETLDARRVLSQQILNDMLKQQSLLVLLTVLTVWIATREAVRPLDDLSRQIGTRNATDLTPFSRRMVYRELHPLIRALNAYMERLQRLIAGQQRFIADAAHQIRTPLAVLQAHSELALRATDAQEQQQQMRAVQQTARDMVERAERLLTLARLEHSQAAQAFAPVDLGPIVRQICLAMSSPALNKRIALALDGAETAIVRGNDALLHEMLANLVDNAIRYTPGEGSVTVRLQSAAGAVIVEVEDSGPGVPEAERSKVLDPFYRLSGSSEGGSGLGLAIVKDICAIHGATLTLEHGNHLGGLRVCVAFQSAPPA